MKKVVLGGMTLVVCALGSPALAADLPAEPAYSSPLIVPRYDWTGFYIGVNAGYSWGQSAAAFNLAGFPPSSGTHIMNGWVAGGQAGVNWQFNGNLVAGLEADFQAARQDGTINYTAGPLCATTGTVLITTTCTTGSASLEQRLPWFATVRGRLGVVLVPHWMIYATGGVAYGEIDDTVSITTNTTTSQSVLGFPLGTTTTSAIAFAVANNRRAGWVAGGGIEYVLSGPWTAKLEYLFVDYGTFSSTYTLAGVPMLTLSSHVRDNIVRVGLNYRFGEPVVAKY
jgi:outer membrane immunogenic protein